MGHECWRVGHVTERLGEVLFDGDLANAEVVPSSFAGVGFDLGETLVDYEGVPLDWEGEYPASLGGIRGKPRCPAHGATTDRLRQRAPLVQGHG